MSVIGAKAHHDAMREILRPMGFGPWLPIVDQIGAPIMVIRTRYEVADRSELRLLFG